MLFSYSTSVIKTSSKRIHGRRAIEPNTSVIYSSRKEQIMQPNLKLAAGLNTARSSTGRDAALTLVRNLVLHPLTPVPQNGIHASPRLKYAKARPAYALLAAVVSMHLAGITWLLNAAPDLAAKPELKTELSVISVSLLSPALAAPTTIVAAATKPKAAAKPVNKPVNKPVEDKVEKLSPAKIEPLTTKPVTTVAEATAATAAKADLNLIAAPAEIAAPVAKVVAEPSIEPPSFAAAYLNNPAPQYPQVSRRVGEQGRVLLRVLVSSSGLADSVQVETSSGSSKLDQAALKAVEKWNFVPAKRSNQPVSAYVLVPIKFSLNG
jgi:protein TonB